MSEILVGVDGSAPGDAATAWAAHEAERRGVRLHVVHVGGRLGDDRTAQEAAELARAVGEVQVDAEFVTGKPQDKLLELAGRAELVVLGTHGHGAVASLVVGSVALALAGSAPVPVVLVKDHDPEKDDCPVVVGVAETPAAVVLGAAEKEAGLRGEGLWLVHAWFEPPVESFGAPAPLPPIDPSPVVAALRERLTGELAPWLGRPDADLRVVPGHPRDVLLAASEDAALVVVGRHEKPGRRIRALGATTHGLIRKAACPVMVVGDEESA
ncbi:universal stress protein [Actinocorallia sp. A-T 12471]|uniref:universal stress protein n=1 Tax=Actinocorallia sp. A-T 12471 TaxID=3089813 RepID=UPI0029CC0CDA|nr:universal stress protein [Actinocorallia sp. A-T 12471]MDX6740009.1 universal stress protein [Actinocorallia sp. A-T 12471]